MVRRIPPNQIEVLFEFHHVGGNSVRISAIDPITNTEVVIVGDRRLSDKQLRNEAARKLIYILKKNRQKKELENTRKNMP